MKKIVVFFLCCFMIGCSPTDENHMISADEALDKVRQGAVLLDVRQIAEYRQGHIEGSTNVPLHMLEEEIRDRVSDKDTVIIVYCQSGNRSQQAVDILEHMGYAQVYDLGGITHWPYDIVK